MLQLPVDQEQTTGAHLEALSGPRCPAQPAPVPPLPPARAWSLPCRQEGGQGARGGWDGLQESLDVCQAHSFFVRTHAVLGTLRSAPSTLRPPVCTYPDSCFPDGLESLQHLIYHPVVLRRHGGGCAAGGVRAELVPFAACRAVMMPSRCKTCSVHKRLKGR